MTDSSRALSSLTRRAPDAAPRRPLGLALVQGRPTLKPIDGLGRRRGRHGSTSQKLGGGQPTVRSLLRQRDNEAPDQKPGPTPHQKKRRSLACRRPSRSPMTVHPGMISKKAADWVPLRAHLASHLHR
jgi:hypothetical protein